ncbi:protein lin-28 homolog B isoform X2 [Anopheles gambiae]|uniref:protein lin-28 homolog B isoform X2 n=1 Tax=Anopheles gambiae TaxID=7165 RepID=UPI002AC99B99|nr:protein lin-28 homolog B isoform X2 [Anopheles gambiae]
MEMSHRGTDEMHNSRQKSEVQHIEHGANKTKKSFQSSSQASSSQSSGRLSNKQNGGNKRCYRCGDPDHYADKCKHKATICKYCKKAGHLERMCLTKTNEKGTDDAHHLEEQPCVMKDVLHLNAIQGIAAKYPSLVDLDVVSHPCSTRTSSTAIFYYDVARISSEHNYVDNARFIELPTENDRLTLPAPYNPFIGPKTSKELNINSTFLTNDSI